MADKRITDLAKQGFTGVDVSLDISLREYGLAWKPDNEEKSEFCFIVGMSSEDGEYTRFFFSHLTKKDYEEAFYFEPDRAGDICAFTGQSLEELKEGFPCRAYDVMVYYGYEEVFGNPYFNGFTIDWDA